MFNNFKRKIKNKELKDIFELLIEKNLSVVITLNIGLAFILTFAYYTGKFRNVDISITIISNIPIIFICQIFIIFIICMFLMLIKWGCDKTIEKIKYNLKRKNVIYRIMDYMILSIVTNILIVYLITVFLYDKLNMNFSIAIFLSLITFSIIILFLKGIRQYRQNSKKNNLIIPRDAFDLAVEGLLFITAIIFGAYYLGQQVSKIELLNNIKITENQNVNIKTPYKYQRIIFQYNDKAIVNDCNMQENETILICNQDYNYLINLTNKKIYTKTNIKLKKED